MEEMINNISVLGLTIVGATLAAILWSIWYPRKRIWPPQRYSWFTPIAVWGPTFALFGAIIALGVLDWGSLPFPAWLRFGVGLVLIVLGNIAVWAEVAGFGVAQTGGARGALKTNGLYRYSRNPQYVADITMLAGWALLSASSAAIPVIVSGILVLLVAPFAEEPWMHETYGTYYAEYKKRVRRFL